MDGRTWGKCRLALLLRILWILDNQQSWSFKSPLVMWDTVITYRQIEVRRVEVELDKDRVQDKNFPISILEWSTPAWRRRLTDWIFGSNIQRTFDFIFPLIVWSVYLYTTFWQGIGLPTLDKNEAKKQILKWQRSTKKFYKQCSNSTKRKTKNIRKVISWKE